MSDSILSIVALFHQTLLPTFDMAGGPYAFKLNVAWMHLQGALQCLAGGLECCEIFLVGPKVERLKNDRQELIWKAGKGERGI